MALPFQFFKVVVEPSILERRCSPYQSRIPRLTPREALRRGTTDEYGIHVAENGVHVHDFHATILHLLGIDHEKLTYRHAGRDYRLTDVEGHVEKEILA